MAAQLRRASAPGRVISALVTLLVLALLAGIGVLIVSLVRTDPFVLPAAQGCEATAAGQSSSLDLEQSGNLAIIVGESIRRGLPPRAATIAIATAMQESRLRNLDHGDRDSVGLFQQRPSQGWGTVEQIMDPWYSAARFYEALVKVPGWSTGDINDVAQRVQRSGVPQGYRPHEPMARIWASALTGHSTAAVRCVDRTSEQGDPAGLNDYLVKVFGTRLQVDPGTHTGQLRAADQTTGWAITQLSIVQTAAVGLSGAEFAGRSWTHDPKEWVDWTAAPPSPSAEAALQVQLRFRTP